MIIDMPTVSMGNSGSVLPADKVSCIDAQGNTSDVQTELEKLYDGAYYPTPSEGEVRIGKYLGKDLYRKAIKKTGLHTNAAYTTFDHEISNLDAITNYSGAFKRSDNLSGILPQVTPHAINSQIAIGDFTSTQFAVTIGNDWATANVFLTEFTVFFDYVKQ